MAKDKKKGGKKDEAVDAPLAGRSRLCDKFDNEVRPAVAEKFGITNRMAQPTLEKITININMGRHLDETKIPPNVKETVLQTLMTISGQKPVVLKAKKSVSNFKVRAGYETAAMVTLRRDRMWHFMDRLINLAIPRIKDFRGVRTNAFDKGGTYSLGITEQAVWPEINMANVTFSHGMHINLVFEKSDPKLSTAVLKGLGMPFTRDESDNRKK